jgi:hypothetical protein
MTPYETDWKSKTWTVRYCDPTFTDLAVNDTLGFYGDGDGIPGSELKRTSGTVIVWGDMCQHIVPFAGPPDFVLLQTSGARPFIIPIKLWCFTGSLPPEPPPLEAGTSGGACWTADDG